MASKVASPALQQGTSLVELLIASGLSLMAIISIGSIYVTAQKSSTQRSFDLLVMQSMSDTLKYIKEDALRAGFNGNNTGSAIVSGADQVFVTTPSSIAYVYLNKDNKYEHTFFKYDDNNVKVCTKQSPTIVPYASCTRFYRMLDEKQISISDFSVTTVPLGSPVKSAFVEISMTGALKGSNRSVTLSTSFKQRNWK